MLSNKNTGAPVRSLSTITKNHNNVLPFLDVSVGSVYSDPDESFESLIPSDPRLSDFTVLKLLGAGGHSKVFLVQEKLTSRLQALKVISKGHQGDFNGIISEQRIQAKLSTDDHECFLPLISSWHDGNNFYLISEYLGGGDMAFEMIRSRTFDEDRSRFYVAEIFIALEILHSQKIIHRDVKPANIMFRADGHIVLGDFGYSKLFGAPTGRSSSPFDVKNPPEYVSFDVTADSDSGSFLTEESYSTSEICGTPYYMAPEQHLGDEYSFEIDYWGMGVMLYRMLTARMPFGGDAKNKAEIGTSVIKDELQFLESDNVSAVAQDLLKGLLAKSPSNRLSPRNIKEHPFFKGFSWDKAAHRQLKAPWIPYISPPPKNPSTTLTIAQGTTYDITTDPFPQFRFTCSKPYQRRLQPVTEPKGSREVFKKASSFLGGLLKKSPKSKVYLSPKVLRPPLRPLILPGMVKECSDSHSSVSIVREKALLDSGFLSESNYSTYSKHIKSPILKVAPPSQVIVISPSSTLGCGNPGVVDIVYPDATMCCTGSHSPAVSRSPAIPRPPAAPPPLSGSLSTVVTRAHPGIVIPIPAGSPYTSHSRPGSHAVFPGSCTPLSASRASLPGSHPPIPFSHHPTAGSHSPKNANGRKEYRGGPPGLSTRFRAPIAIPLSTKHTGRPHHAQKNFNGGPWATSNNSPHDRLCPGVHPNVLLNRPRKSSSPSIRIPGRRSRPEGQQAYVPNVERSRSASPPLGSNDMNRQHSTFPPSVAGVLGYVQGKPFLVKFDLIPDNFRIGRRHPAFLSSVHGAPGFLNPRYLEIIVRPNSTIRPQVPNDVMTRRGGPSVSPAIPLVPRTQLLRGGHTRSHSVMPIIVSDTNYTDNRRKFSAPVPRISGRPRDERNISRTRSDTHVLHMHMSSTPKDEGSLLPTSTLPSVPAMPAHLLGAHVLRNRAHSVPILVSPSICEVQPQTVPDSILTSGSSSGVEGAPTTLAARFKSWMRRLFDRGHSDLTLRRGREISN